MYWADSSLEYRNITDKGLRMKTLTTKLAIPASALLGITSLSMVMLSPVTASRSFGAITPGVVTIPAVVRDFNPTHPDFGVTDPNLFGHHVGMVASTLDLEGNPIGTGFGFEVTQQWLDKDGNPIAPYGDPGLAGGHFDVDVHDVEPSTNELYHEHQFDDKFNVTYVDMINDANLLFDPVVGAGYPNDIRVTMMNTINGGGGWFTFESGGVAETTYTRNWTDRVFTPGQLTQFRVDFLSLAEMRATSPGTVQGDAINRDGALAIKMYDTVTNAMIYELDVYHHFKKKNPIIIPTPVAAVGVDACGVPFNDTPGTYGSANSAGVTDTSTFRQWFRDVPGTNVSGLVNIPLTLNGAGVYEYMTNSFFPVDGQLLGNDTGTRNEMFTLSMSMAFQYTQCTGMFFEFESNDDAWVFINGKLVMDIGGVSTPSKQYVSMDRLGLMDGQIYSIEVFYARRRPSSISTFNMRTNIGFLVGQTPTTSALWD
jgi:fibro-slime domain-containing protein